MFVALFLFSGKLIAQSETPPECLNLEEIQQKIGYPKEAKSAGTFGKVIAKVTVSTSGKVEKSEIMESPSPILSEAVLAKIGGLKFNPAKMNGKPVKSIVQVPILFELPAEPKVFTSLEGALTTTSLVEALDLSGQNLSEIDKRISRLKSLRIIILDDNAFTAMPKVLKKLKALEEISISGNQLTNAPSFLKKLKNLRKLDISDNAMSKEAAAKAREQYDYLELMAD